MKKTEDAISPIYVVLETPENQIVRFTRYDCDAQLFLPGYLMLSQRHNSRFRFRSVK